MSRSFLLFACGLVRLSASPLAVGMKVSEILTVSGAFAVAAIAATSARIGYGIFVLKQTDDKLGTPIDQFVTVTGVHVFATLLAMIAFAVGLRLASASTSSWRTLVLAAAVVGMAVGFVTVVELGDWIEPVLPLSGWSDEIVAVSIGGIALGALVAAAGRLHRTSPAG